MISLEDWANNPTGSIIEMAAGSIGAARVASELYVHNAETARGIMALMHADDMGIRGSQLWVAYKYHCDQNLSQLCNRLIVRDEKLKGPRTNE